jgi:hypothetical protein
MHAATIAALLFAVSGAAPLQVVEQECDMVSVCHMPVNCILVFFWADVQGKPTCLAHRWSPCAMEVTARDGGWQLEWDDNEDSCHRIIRTPIWVESWEQTDPRVDEGGKNRQWRNQLEPGLKQPPKLAGDEN